MRGTITISLLVSMAAPASADPLAPLSDVVAPIVEIENPARMAAYEQERIDHQRAVADYRARRADYERKAAETRARSQDVRAALAMSAGQQQEYRRRLEASRDQADAYLRARAAYERCLADLAACED